MEWTFEARECLKRSEIKALVDEMVSDEVVKSAMVGSVYYAAVKRGKEVTGLVVLTSIRNRELMNFGTKFIPECLGPFQIECPESILKLLTPVKGYGDSAKWAREWRDRCHEVNKNKKRLKAFPVGTVIEFRGVDYTKEKRRSGTKWCCDISQKPEAEIARGGFRRRETGK